ncbi:hypothetical protein [Pseudemcibacter aquimaris]|uniref:hypothetical protein n=1 Tax=Pseudemcibacter aquimaris TaxID=2857064 RepID=UPI0020127B76|nr:hypothetical protein [Pseudemcibacter aquimaris]MCC3860298.1 hypothetical protein [Pseudemcibacter aquimaris]WDU57622.1 hypothetical protein KW060_10490 [Pseudemcibacter aquimaris]
MDKIKEKSLEFFACIVILIALAGTVYNSAFSTPPHFIIPTQILMIGVFFGNLVYYSTKGKKWAKIILFWIFCLGDFCAFLAIFNSPSLAKVSYGPVLVAVLVPFFTYLLYSYQKIHSLFKD